MSRSPLHPESRFGSLLNLGLCMGLVYAALLLRFPLLELYTRQRFVLKDYAGTDASLGTALTIGLIILFAAYTAGAMLMRRVEQPGRRTTLVLLIVPIVCATIVFMTQSITSTDLYDYLFRGRMIARYGANTFTTPPNVYGGDPMFVYVVWRNAVSAYGPLWEGLSWLASRLAGEAPQNSLEPTPALLFRLLMAYKILAALGWVLCSATLWFTLKRVAPTQRWLGMYLWLWNPLVLWETLAAGHNDVLMVLPILLAVWALTPTRDSHGRLQAAGVAGSLGSLVALTVGGLVKYLSLMLGPLALAASLRRLPTWRERIVLVLAGGLVCLGLVVAGYAFFWQGPETLANFKNRRDLYNMSWLAALRPILAQRTSPEQAKDIASGIALALLVPGVLWATWRSWRAPERLAEPMLWLLLWFLFVCNPWFHPWYVIWPLALVALQPQRWSVVLAVVLFGFTSMLSYIIITFIMLPRGLSSATTTWHGWLSLLIYLPPLLVLAWNVRMGAFSTARNGVEPVQKHAAS